MYKQDIANLIHANYGGAKTKADAMVDGIIESIANALAKDEKVTIAGLGILRTQNRQARVARNPKTGEQVQVPAAVVVKFRPSQTLKDLLNK